MTLTVSTGAGGAAAANAMASDNWPDSLKEYVAKCFNKCHNEIDKDQVEIILKGKITKAASDGVLHTKVWITYFLASKIFQRLLELILA